MKTVIGISDLRHRVTLCSAKDETVNNVDIMLKRVGVFDAWASIQPVRGQFFAGGYAEKESRDHYSHHVWIRFRSDLDITAWAWVYESRPTGARWYKVLAVEEIDENGRFWRMQCRLSQKSEDAVKPASGAGAFDTLPLPEGVRI